MRVMLMLFFIGLSATLRCQSDTIYWTQLAPLPDSIQRSFSGYFLIDSNFYVAGGAVGYGSNYDSNTNVVWQYHIPTNTWYQKNNYPFSPAFAGGSFVLNNKGYFLCSQVYVSGGSYCSHMFWRYDPVNDSWARMADFPDSPRYGSAFFTYGGKGYVGETGACGLSDSHFWAYEPDSNQWYQVASLPSSITGHSEAGSVFIAPYLLGGIDDGNNAYENLWSYDVISNVWNALQPISSHGRSFPFLIGIDSILIGGSGAILDSSLNTDFLSDFYKYDITTNTWSPMVFINSFDSTSAGFSFVYNKRGYYFGGISSFAANTTSNKLWSFDASKYLTDTTHVGIQEVPPPYQFKVYPNPLDKQKTLNVQCSESGDITFYDLLGRVTYHGILKAGVNTFSCSELSCERNILLYKAKMQSGRTENGKIVTLK